MVSTYNAASVWPVWHRTEDTFYIMRLIRGNEESVYRDKVNHLETWCRDINLVLNMNKTKDDSRILEITAGVRNPEYHQL